MNNFTLFNSKILSINEEENEDYKESQNDNSKKSSSNSLHKKNSIENRY